VRVHALMPVAIDRACSLAAGSRIVFGWGAGAALWCGFLPLPAFSPLSAFPFGKKTAEGGYVIGWDWGTPLTGKGDKEGHG